MQGEKGDLGMEGPQGDQGMNGTKGEVVRIAFMLCACVTVLLAVVLLLVIGNERR